jgi:hypothetical protein
MTSITGESEASALLGTVKPTQSSAAITLSDDYGTTVNGSTARDDPQRSLPQTQTPLGIDPAGQLRADGPESAFEVGIDGRGINLMPSIIPTLENEQRPLLQRSLQVGTVLASGGGYALRCPSRARLDRVAEASRVSGSVAINTDRCAEILHQTNRPAVEMHRAAAEARSVAFSAGFEGQIEDVVHAFLAEGETVEAGFRAHGFFEIKKAKSPPTLAGFLDPGPAVVVLTRQTVSHTAPHGVRF